MEMEDRPAFALIGQLEEGFLATMEELPGEAPPPALSPFVSATGYLYDSPEQSRNPYGTVYFLLSDLARHTRNLKKNPEASFLVIENAGQTPVHEKKRFTFQGRISRVENGAKVRDLKKRYLERFPRSQVFFDLPDFRFYELKVREIHWILGFGKAGTLK